jgi:membrane protease subunit HflK
VHGHGHDHEHVHDHGHGPAGARAPAPELEVDPAQESLAGALRAGFNVLRVLMVVLLVAYFLSGWFQVGPGEQGLIVRFGKLRINESSDSRYRGTPVFGEGPHFALPDPFDEKIAIAGQTHTLDVDTFLFSIPEKERPQARLKPLKELAPDVDQLTPGVDGAMLSGDRNLSHGRWRVTYHIENAARFAQNVGETHAALQPILRALTESAVVQAVAGRRVEEVLREALAAVQEDVKARLSRELERLETGIRVDNVVAETIEPGSVRSAFLGVTEAQNERKRLIDQARQTREQVLNEAAGQAHAALLGAVEAYGAAQAAGADAARLDEMLRQIDAQLDGAGGEVAVLLGRARAEASETREAFNREYEEFTALLPLYHENPELTLRDVWTRMRDEILDSKQNDVFYVPGFGIVEIVTNRDPLKAVEADLERYQKRDPGRSTK